MGQERKWLVDFQSLVRYSLVDRQTYREDFAPDFQTVLFLIEGCPVPGKIDTTLRGYKELFEADAPGHILWESAVPVPHGDEAYYRN